MEITVGVICPELLNMFGDSGNIKAIEKRLLWRDIEVKIKEFNLSDEITLDGIDIVYLGGGGEKETLIVKDKLDLKKEELKSYIENDGVLIAVCSGFEIIGNKFFCEGAIKEGLGLLDIKASLSNKRLVSDVILETDFGTVVGFENHIGKMDIGEYKELGKVIYGNGNNGEDKKEGLIYKNTFASYLDGPLLPKNPELTDEIIKRALEKKYNENISLK